MTWKEFKEMVDQQVATTGKSEDSLHIWYIDVSFPEKIEVEFSEDISNGNLNNHIIITDVI